MKNFLPCSCLLLFAAYAAAPAFGQSTFATLTGTVTDPSGAVVQGARVSATRIGTDATINTITDSAGVYRLLNLDAGRYLVEATAPGFNTETRHVELLARQTLRADVQLEAGGAQEMLTVTAEASAIETDRATLDSRRSGDEIAKLALNFNLCVMTSSMPRD